MAVSSCGGELFTLSLERGENGGQFHGGILSPQAFLYSLQPCQRSKVS